MLDLVSGCFLFARKTGLLAAVGRLFSNARQASVYVFPGRPSGQFGDREVLHDVNDEPVTDTHPEREGRSRQIGTEPFFTDFDGDGDLDLLVGNMEGEIILVRNNGRRGRNRFATVGERLEHDDRPIRVPGGEAGPEVADFDGDGLTDLLSGSSAGAVVWFRNVGSLERPRFDRGARIVDSSWSTKFLFPGEKPSPGWMSRIHVTDYDGDGKLDLLLGDVQFIHRFRSDLAPEQCDRARTLRTRFLEALSTQDYESKERLETQLRALADPSTTHGFIWFFRRR